MLNGQHIYQKDIFKYKFHDETKIRQLVLQTSEKG